MKRLWESRTMLLVGVNAGLLVLDRVYNSGLLTDPAALKGILLADSILYGLLRMDTKKPISIRKPTAGAGAAVEA